MNCPWMNNPGRGPPMRVGSVCDGEVVELPQILLPIVINALDMSTWRPLMAPIDHLLNPILVPFEESFHRSIPPIFYPSEDAELIGHLPRTVAEENALNPSPYNDPGSDLLRLLALFHSANPMENCSSCLMIMSKKLAQALIKSKLDDPRVY